MSEKTMSAEMGSPRDRAIAYLEMRQGGRFISGKEKNIKTPLIPDKVRKTEPLVDSVTAYEKVIDTLGDKGYEGLQQKLEGWRPAMYDAMRAVQWGARLGDYILTGAFILAPGWVHDRMPTNTLRTSWVWQNLTGNPIGRITGAWLTNRFRPIEWATGKVMRMGGAVASSEFVAPVVNSILGGGERIQKKPAEMPTAT